MFPLKFEPIFQYRLWGGKKLANFLPESMPKQEPIGEAWLLSDRADHPSMVKDGPLRGRTIADLLKEYPTEFMGKLEGRFDRFPLLLKFLDCKKALSVQVHPSDDQKQYIFKGDTGKTEAWVVLETTAESRVYAGLKHGTTESELRDAITSNKLANKLHSFVPKSGDGVFIQSGTVHSLGGTVVFEVQENSDVTFRLYDWDRVDEKTGKPRDLQVEEAIACIDFKQVDIDPVIPLSDYRHPTEKEQLFNCDHFVLWRIKSGPAFTVGAENEPRVLVCIEGHGELHSKGVNYPLNKGEVLLLPAIAGECTYLPFDKTTVLEIGIPNFRQK